MKKHVYDVDTILTFGIHKDETIQQVFENDCQYLVWMYENFDKVDWSDNALKLVTEAIDIVSYDRSSSRKDYFSEVDGFHGDEWIFGNSPHDFFD